MSQPLWTPSDARVARAQLTRFRAQAEDASGQTLENYDQLWTWSVENPASFWKLAWESLGVVRHQEPSVILQGHDISSATWFKDATLNYAENLLQGPDDKVAVIACGQGYAAPREVTMGELRTHVGAMQRFLLQQGVEAGDRVAAFLPNRLEAVVTMLAASSIGAIYSSSSPDFGLKGVLDRFGQIAPKVLVATDGSHYGGKSFDTRDRVAQIADALSGSLTALVMVGVVDPATCTEGIPGAIAWDEALAGPDVLPTFTPLPFDHPLYILYSSGTTGVPKCIVHGAGGTLLQHLKEHRLHTDVQPGDVVFYFTTTGWMMWNWLVSGLAAGASIVLWDGSPAYPSAAALWEMAEQHRVTVFGTSPKFLSMCEKEGLCPKEQFNLSRLRTVLSTGSPLSVDNFNWVYASVHPDVQLASICGGTDIVSCFMLGVPTVPVYPGEIQRRGLGMAVDAWSDDRQPIRGQKAELVCTAPFPSRPVAFWNDPNGERYHAAYFSTYEGVWRHGDYIEITSNNGIVVYGRSDATLNPGGVRIGTAEIYRPVESMDQVRESIVVGVPTADDDVSVVLFVALQPGVTFDASLEQAIKKRIRALASPRHVPRSIHVVDAVPRTLSGKKVEIAVRRTLLGEDVANRDALANPEALDAFAALRDAVHA